MTIICTLQGNQHQHEYFYTGLCFIIAQCLEVVLGWCFVNFESYIDNTKVKNNNYFANWRWHTDKGFNFCLVTFRGERGTGAQQSS